ncbi:F-box domain-containing protein [Artemisia annua]|uniref:F-box domain-containing protein n=1 Tax=Artemisia annua TaxID=35608 RepID=A0A2U1KCY9_ARTAN|nr:F-box domain-containing protein [Artemisia annua]
MAAKLQITSAQTVQPFLEKFQEGKDLHTDYMYQKRSPCDKSCGLGFDFSTNTFKMSWREIPRVPSYPIEGKAVFSNGCLHWLVSVYDRQSQDDRSHVISFDLKEEEFGLKNPPISIGNPLKRDISRDYDQLIKLNGQVGYFCNSTMEVWVLNHKQEWVPHCRMDDLPNQWLDVLVCLNKDRDILGKVVIDLKDRFFVYSMQSGSVDEAKIAGRENENETAGIAIYPNSLLSIHGCFNTNSIKYLKKKSF